MDAEQIKQLANDVNRVAKISFKSGKEQEKKNSAVNEAKIKQLQAENEYLKREVVDLHFLSGDCVDKVSVESQIREKPQLLINLNYELELLKGGK